MDTVLESPPHGDPMNQLLAFGISRKSSLGETGERCASLSDLTQHEVDKFDRLTWEIDDKHVRKPHILSS